MLRNLTRQSADSLTRAQLLMFHVLSDQINLTPDDRRRALDLDDRAWAAWAAFLRNGPRPAEPPLPVMLFRVGRTTFNLSVVASDHPRDIAHDQCKRCYNALSGARGGA